MDVGAGNARATSEACGGAIHSSRCHATIVSAIAASDLLAIALAAVIVSPAVSAAAAGPVQISLWLGVLAAAVLAARLCAGAYRVPLTGAPEALASEAVLITAAVGSLWLVGVAGVMSLSGAQFGTLALMIAVAAVLAGLGAFLVGQTAMAWYGAERVAPRAVLVSSGSAAPDPIAAALSPGRIAIAGEVDPGSPDAAGILARMVSDTDAEHVVVDLPQTEIGRIGAALPNLAHLDVRVWRLSRDDGIAQPRLVLLRPATVSPFSAAGKRAFDLAAATLCLIVLSPVMLAVAVAIRLDSSGPILFRQLREGRNGRPFGMLKFRSMYASASDPSALQLTAKADPRVTRVGRWIRRTSLDEIPQLINVLTGDMSIVGPRPLPLAFSHRGVLFEEVIPSFRARLSVKPGITGLAQLRGQRGTPEDIDEAIAAIDARIRSDLEYIGTWSFWGDLRILVATALGGAWLAKAY
jgi:polysaccharide biosynthesis protein PslA